MNTVLISGNTYQVKDQLKSLGGRWDSAARGWRVPAEKGDAARALVSAPTPAAKPVFHSRLVCRSCGQSGTRGNYPFSTMPGSGRCDDCC